MWQTDYKNQVKVWLKQRRLLLRYNAISASGNQAIYQPLFTDTTSYVYHTVTVFLRIEIQNLSLPKAPSWFFLLPGRWRYTL